MRRVRAPPIAKKWGELLMPRGAPQRYFPLRRSIRPREREGLKMGFYDKWVLPRLLNLLMGNKFATEARKQCLAGVL